MHLLLFDFGLDIGVAQVMMRVRQKVDCDLADRLEPDRRRLQDVGHRNDDPGLLLDADWINEYPKRTRARCENSPVDFRAVHAGYDRSARCGLRN